MSDTIATMQVIQDGVVVAPFAYLLASILAGVIGASPLLLLAAVIAWSERGDR